MRVDLFGLSIMQGWLQANAPDQAWTEDMPAHIQGAANVMLTINPVLGAALTAQAMIACIAIERWKLQQVVILGGGRPTPFSPSPEQVLYYTDINLEALTEAKQQGYRVLHLDTRRAQDYTKLTGARTAIATGLFHFLPDLSFQDSFIHLAEAGIQQVVFSHADSPLYTQETMYPRSIAEVQALLPAPWSITAVVPLTEFVRDFSPLGATLSHQPQTINVFLATRG